MANPENTPQRIHPWVLTVTKEFLGELPANGLSGENARNQLVNRIFLELQKRHSVAFDTNQINSAIDGLLMKAGFKVVAQEEEQINNFATLAKKTGLY